MIEEKSRASSDPGLTWALGRSRTVSLTQFFSVFSESYQTTVFSERTDDVHVAPLRASVTSTALTSACRNRRAPYIAIHMVAHLGYFLLRL